MVPKVRIHQKNISHWNEKTEVLVLARGRVYLPERYFTQSQQLEGYGWKQKKNDESGQHLDQDFLVVHISCFLF